MSRIGKNPIAIPAGVDVAIDGQNVTVKGPKGTLSHVVAEPITAKVEDGQVVVERPNDERTARSLHGLSRTLIANMIVGVTEGYKKDLEITGTGYRVVAKGKDLEFSLGFSHTITITPPEGIEFTIAPKSQTLFTVSGIDQQLVGARASPSGRHPFEPPHGGAGHRRYGGSHAGVGLRHRSGPGRFRGHEDRQGPQGRRPDRRAREGRRNLRRRLRPRW